MLGKLMKYEWKATWKLLLSANILTVVMTGLARCMVYLMGQTGHSDFRMVDFMAVMVLFTYVGSMFAVCIGTTIYLIHRFYTSTYGDQGYLLHTLPVDTHHIIIAKVLVSSAWVIINMVSIYLSVIFLLATSSEIFHSMMEGMVDMIEYLGAGKEEDEMIFQEAVLEDTGRYIETFGGKMLYGRGFAREGMSGGGIFDGRGRLIGLLAGGTYQNEIAGVPVDQVAEAYREIAGD